VAAVTEARPHARELGAEPALEGVERIIREGCAAQRRRAAHGRSGMTGMLAQAVEETAS
jgi:gamma-glutamyl:cysteine ligase YbdK (ATP-grasp superfamily)